MAATPGKITPAERINLLVARFTVRSSENQWRGIQRNAISIFVVGIPVGAYFAGTYALAAPLLLMFFAATWGQHDDRIGDNSRYIGEGTPEGVRVRIMLI